MPFADAEQRREYAKEWARKHKIDINLYKRKRYGDKRREIDCLKSERGCKVCGETHPATLDFHHRNPKDKVDSVARMLGSVSWQKVLEEIEKCDVICSNCHRKLHWSECELRYLDNQPRCRNLPQLEKRKVKWPALEQLRLDITELGYRGTGRKYGVSDSAVRNWIKVMTASNQTSLPSNSDCKEDDSNPF